MEFIIVSLQCALSGVLAVAAAAKLMDLPGSRKAVNDFGVPRRLADPLGTALPIVELLLAILLLPGATARWSAAGAALLFLAFIAGIGFNLARGRKPDCHCFGQFHSEPAGWSTIVRNTIFTAMALLITWKGSPGPVDWFSGLEELSQIVVVLGTLAVAALGLQCWLLFQLSRHIRALPQRSAVTDSTLPVFESEPENGGSFVPRSAPPFELPTVSGGRITLKGLLGAGKPILLLFVDPGCAPCRFLVPDIQEWHRRFSDEFEVALISRGSVEDNQEKFGDLLVGLQEDRETYDLYKVQGTPTDIFINADGMIREPYAPGRDNIRELIVGVMGNGPATRRANRQTPRAVPDPHDFLHRPKSPDLGTAGTRLPLPDLDGGYVGLDDLRGQRTALVFFSPDCAFCQRMLPDLREWEEEAGSATQGVLVVSNGSADANRELGLRSRIVLDNAFVAGNAYGVTGTPSAIVLDEEGRVASPVAVGADAVLDLLVEEILAPSNAAVPSEA